MPSGPLGGDTTVFEGRKVEGNWKNRWEIVPQAGFRKKETITEPINSCTGEFRIP